MKRNGSVYAAMNHRVVSDRDIILAIENRIKKYEQTLKIAPDSDFTRDMQKQLNRIREARDILRTVFGFTTEWLICTNRQKNRPSPSG